MKAKTYNVKLTAMEIQRFAASVISDVDNSGEPLGRSGRVILTKLRPFLSKSDQREVDKTLQDDLDWDYKDEDAEDYK